MIYSLEMNEKMLIIKAIPRMGATIRYRLMPLLFMAVISLFLKGVEGHQC